MRQALAEDFEGVLFGIGGAGCAVAGAIAQYRGGVSCYALDLPGAPEGGGAERILLGRGRHEARAPKPDAVTLERYTVQVLPRIDAALLNHYKDVLVIAALGGCTGRTVAPLVIDRARLFGKTVHAFVWLPTVFEDPAARPASLQSLQRIMLEADHIHIQNNDWLVHGHRHLCAERFWGLVESTLVGQILKMV